MSKLFVDLKPMLLTGANGGARNFILNIIDGLAKKTPDFEIICLCKKNTENELITTLGEKSINIHAVNRYSNFIIGNRANDIFFTPFGSTDIKTNQLKRLSICYDFLHDEYPIFFSRKDLRQRQRNMDEVAKNANKIICISKFTRDQALKKGFDAKRLKVIPITFTKTQGIATNSAKRRKNDEEFLLYPANFWKHKNHEMLFAAIKLACFEMKGDGPKIICTGYANKQRGIELKKLIKALRIEHAVTMKGYISDREMKELYEKCTGIIFPSLYEGFGMPVAEAMINGKPVCCSNNTALSEIANGGAHLFDPKNPFEIKTSIINLLKNSVFQKTLVREGSIASKKYQDFSGMINQYSSVIKDLQLDS